MGRYGVQAGGDAQFCGGCTSKCPKPESTAFCLCAGDRICRNCVLPTSDVVVISICAFAKASDVECGQEGDANMLEIVGARNMACRNVRARTDQTRSKTMLAGAEGARDPTCTRAERREAQASGDQQFRGVCASECSKSESNTFLWAQATQNSDGRVPYKRRCGRMHGCVFEGLRRRVWAGRRFQCSRGPPVGGRLDHKDTCARM